MAVRGVRGANSVSDNSPDGICQATKDLLQEIVEKNKIILDDIAAVFFTVTRDLNAEFPAKAARDLGWNSVPMMCQMEIDVPGSIHKLVRVMILLNTTKTSGEIKHVYLGQAKVLRPDLRE